VRHRSWRRVVGEKLLANGRESCPDAGARQAASADPVEARRWASIRSGSSQRLLKAIARSRKGQNLTVAASGDVVTQVGVIGAAAGMYYAFASSAAGTRA